jgi:hypothetical protein
MPWRGRRQIQWISSLLYSDCVCKHKGGRSCCCIDDKHTTMASKPSIFIKSPAASAEYSALSVESGSSTKLGMTDGVNQPAPEPGSAPEGNHVALRWSYIVAGFIQFGLALAAFITIFAVPKPVNASIYTWLYTAGFETSNWNMGAGVGIALCAAGLIELLVGAIPAAYALIASAIETKGVNGMRLAIDLMNDIPLWWFFLQTVHMHDALELTGYVLARLLMDVMLYSTEMQNNHIVMLRNGSRGTRTSAPSYYLELTVVAIAGLFYWLLNGAYYVDSLIGTAQFVPTYIAYTGTVALTGIILALTEWYRPIDLMVRFSRTNVASCFQDKTTTYIVHAWFTFIRVIMVCINIFIAMYYGAIVPPTYLPVV